MKKSFVMLIGLVVVLAAGSACFTPSAKPDPNPPTVRTNHPASVAPPPSATR